MARSGPYTGNVDSNASRREALASEPAIERIGRPSARVQPRTRVQFNAQVWWVIQLVIVGVIYLATALGSQHV
jgi:hypothetical protein